MKRVEWKIYERNKENIWISRRRDHLRSRSSPKFYIRIPREKRKVILTLLLEISVHNLRSTVERKCARFRGRGASQRFGFSLAWNREKRFCERESLSLSLRLPRGSRTTHFSSYIFFFASFYHRKILILEDDRTQRFVILLSKIRANRPYVVATRLCALCL